MLATVVSTDIYNALADKAPFDIDRTRRALAALPDSWHDLAPAPMNRAARRAHARRRTR